MEFIVQIYLGNYIGRPGLARKGLDWTGRSGIVPNFTMASTSLTERERERPRERDRTLKSIALNNGVDNEVFLCLHLSLIIVLSRYVLLSLQKISQICYMDL